MAKFSDTKTAITHRAPITVRTEVPTTRTFEGGAAWQYSPEGELFLLAATNMVGENTFYETGANRDSRFRDLIHSVTAIDPEWVKRFGPYLRNELKMRSASVVLACEYVKAGGPEGRALVNAVCQRADEPGEALGYWTSKYGRSLPAAIKRGVADAATRLYTERNVIKWDSARHGIRFADVIELTHPTPKDERQNMLFKFILDETHHNDGSEEGAPWIAQDAEWFALAHDLRRARLRVNGLPNWWTWERLAGWLPGGMDAEAWSYATANMGTMALIRNLRNLDEKGVDEKTIDAVIAKITDPDEVQRSRIFPYQVWTAYREAPSDNWRRALGKTLDASMVNTPDLGPGTLVLIDTSGSMGNSVSVRSTVSRVEVAAVMAIALAHKHADTDVALFASDAVMLDRTKGESALREIEAICGAIGIVGHGTEIHRSLAKFWNPAKHKRAIIFTDDQTRGSAATTAHVPKIYTWDLAGYGRSSQKNGIDGRYVFGGYSDATMSAVAAIEQIGHTGWPF